MKATAVGQVAVGTVETYRAAKGYLSQLWSSGLQTLSRQLDGKALSLSEDQENLCQNKVKFIFQKDLNIILQLQKEVREDREVIKDIIP